MGLTQLVTPDYSLSKIVSNANNLGQFGISTAFLGSTNSVFSGTGSILKNDISRSSFGGDASQFPDLGLEGCQ